MDKEGLIPLEALVHHNQQKKERYLLFWSSTSKEHYLLGTKKDLDSPCYNHPGRLGIKNQLSIWRFGSIGLNCWWAGGRCVLSVCADWLIVSVGHMVATKQLMSALYLPSPSTPQFVAHPWNWWHCHHVEWTWIWLDMWCVSTVATGVWEQCLQTWLRCSEGKNNRNPSLIIIAAEMDIVYLRWHYIMIIV